MILIGIWSFSSLLVFFPGFIENGKLSDVLGTTITVMVLILIPGSLLGISVLKIKELLKASFIGSAVLLSAIIPLNAYLAKFQVAWILVLLILILSVYLLNKENRFLSKIFDNENISFNNHNILITLLFIVGYIVLIRQSLYVPANNLDQFLVWPDTYNALAQAGEITHHGPSIYPFVADAQVALKYHWGAFSLGSFISLLGNFSLVVSMFKTQFILLGLIYLGLLYFVGQTIGQSWLAGFFAVILGGLTIYPTFPEFNDQIGLARPFISSTSMPQFTANIFAILAIYLIFNFKNNKLSIYLNFVILFIVTLAATLSKGPVGLLIVICALSFVILQFKDNLQKNIIYLLTPTVVGFTLGYTQITNNNSVSGKNGTSLWFNPTDTIKLLTDSYGVELGFKTILIFISLFIVSFAGLLFAIFISWKQKRSQYIWPLILTSFAGITGTLLFEAWGKSQLFFLYGVIPFIGVLLAVTVFFKENSFSVEKASLIGLGLLGQPLIFKLISSFVPLGNILKTFALWILSVLIVWLIAGIFAKNNNNSIINYLLITSIGIGMFSGLTKFDQKAYSLPEHPYSITIGTSAVAEYLRSESNPNDLIATNRHCAGPEENQTCTARQFALSALSERRVFLEGWSYTTCALSEPIFNKYWKEDNWKFNQDFLNNPNAQNWEVFKKSGVDWLVIDTTRPSAVSFTEVADLVKTEGKVSLWKIKNPYLGKIVKQTESCGPESTLVGN
jgi:hypothetical protein